MRVAEFDFDLPDDRIALRPVSPRDAARMLVVGPDGELEDSHVSKLGGYLKAGDVLVFNDTKVIHARLQGERLREGATGAHVDATLHQRLDSSHWIAYLRPGKRVKPGDLIRFGGRGEACYMDLLDATVMEKGDGGEVVLQFTMHGAVLDDAIAAHGAMPLPPYIASKRPVDMRDEDDYQTVFARHDGAVAAPTAGLHFTPELIDALMAMGIQREFVTLHVGAGTFLPVKADDTENHKMHDERGEVQNGVAARLNAVRKNGGRIIAVGTTALRLLESAVDENGVIQPFSDKTGIFITPGYEFRGIDGLVTNFHLPRSTLFMLVSALCGLNTMRKAYAHAIANNYRFYSYGDASLLLPRRG